MTLINLKKSVNKKLLILILVNEKNKKWIKDNKQHFTKYFDIKFVFDKPSNIKKYLKDSIDILIMDKPTDFEITFYHNFQKNNPSFFFATLAKEVSKKDISTFKDDLSDRILYSGYGDQFLVWSLISLLRRYWNNYSKPSTIIYKGIIADFSDSHFIIDKKQVDLTPKEIKILKMLLENKHEFISKQKIFKKIWGHDDVDSTRTVDQTIFKLKKKIGEKYFTFARKKGIKFE